MDTKFGTFKVVVVWCDLLIFGGVVYNVYLCVKYDIEVEGVSEGDVELVREFLSFEA